MRAEHELHLRKADVFTVQINEITEAAKSMESNCDTAVLAMNFQKNLPLPLTGVSQEYYKRQLWMHNLCIHDNVSGLATMFLYSEHFAGKGPNEVISCLAFYFSGLDSSVKKVHLFVDNCFSQNKNRYLFAYLHAMAQVKFESVYVHYPLPGHSRMPCDRNFGRIEKRRRKKDRVSKPSEWVNLIKETDIVDPFKVVYVEHPLTDNLVGDGTPLVKIKDYKKAYDRLLRLPKGIAALRGLLCLRGAEPKVRYSMTGECQTPMHIPKRGQKMKSLIAATSRVHTAYCRFLPIKPAKLKDVQELLKHVLITEDVTFYNHLTSSESNDVDSEDELE